jgi:hypothetical protein
MFDKLDCDEQHKILKYKKIKQKIKCDFFKLTKV